MQPPADLLDEGPKVAQLVAAQFFDHPSPRKRAMILG
jgi:hypothetical protein